MDRNELVEQILATWRRHDAILVYLLDQVSAEGLTAVPIGSRGRDVARQFAHLDRVRRGWLEYHTTGQRAKFPRQDKGPSPSKATTVPRRRPSFTTRGGPG